MIDKSIIKRFTSFFDDAESVALLCHLNPDSDTLGSALSLMLALKKLGKRCDVFCDDNPPERLSFLPAFDKVNSPSDNMKKYDLCVAVDCASVERFNVVGKYFKNAKKTLVIDHHKTGRNYADFTVCDEYAAATAEIMYSVIECLSENARRELFDKDIATLLFAAIVGDTGAFAFDNVNPNTFEIAGKLLKYGVDSHFIVYTMMKEQAESRYKLKARAMSGTKFFDDGQIGIITLKLSDFSETGAATSETEGIINELIDVSGVKIAFSISEVADKYYKASIRTKAPYDASRIAVVFGGGGHERAAGCRISGYYEDIVDKILKSARDEI